jgi:hypothetical protein
MQDVLTCLLACCTACRGTLVVVAVTALDTQHSQHQQSVRPPIISPNPQLTSLLNCVQGNVGGGGSHSAEHAR